MSTTLPKRAGRLFARGTAPDDRDHRLRAPATKRKRRYWRSWWHGDQGDTPECVGYAAAHWCDARPVHQFLDPTGIYRIAKRFDEWPGTDYDGTSVRAAAKVLRGLGHITEYGWLDSAEECGLWIAERGPVILGLDWLTGMMDPVDGWIRAKGRSVGGHAVLADGVDLPAGWLRIKNSWGRSWGDRGWAKLSLDDLDRLLPRDGEACAASERRPKPEE